MDPASCAAVAGVATVACMSGPRRSAASWDPQLATMVVMVGPGAGAVNHGPLGPYIFAVCMKHTRRKLRSGLSGFGWRGGHPNSY